MRSPAKYSSSWSLRPRRTAVVGAGVGVEAVAVGVELGQAVLVGLDVERADRAGEECGVHASCNATGRPGVRCRGAGPRRLKRIAAARRAKPTSRPIAIAVVVAHRRRRRARKTPAAASAASALSSPWRKISGVRAVRTSRRSAPPEPPSTPISSCAGTVTPTCRARSALGDGEEADGERVEHADRAQDPRSGLAGDDRHDDRGGDHRRQVERVGQRDGRVRVQQQVAQQAAAEAAGESEAEHADEVEAVLPARRERATRRPGGDAE